MDSLLIGSIVVFTLCIGIVSYKKHKERKEQEFIRMMEKYEREKLLKNLEKSWHMFEKTKVRPSIHGSNQIEYNEKEAKNAWNKVMENNRYARK